MKYKEKSLVGNWIFLLVIFLTLNLGPLACAGGGGGDAAPIVDTGSDVFSEGGQGPHCNNFGEDHPERLELRVTGVIDYHGPEPVPEDALEFENPMHVYAGIENDPSQASPNGENQTLMQLAVSMSESDVTILNDFFVIRFYLAEDVLNYRLNGGDLPVEFYTIDQSSGVAFADPSNLPATFSDQFEGEFYSAYGVFDNIYFDPLYIWMDDQGLSRVIVGLACGIDVDIPGEGIVTVSSNPIYFQFHHGYGP